MWQIVFFVIKILFIIWVWKILEVFLPQSQDVFISFCYLVVVCTMTPVLKKNKDRQNPANYRGITVTNIFTKNIQSILKSRVDIQIDQIQNPLQRGSNTHMSPLIPLWYNLLKRISWLSLSKAFSASRVNSNNSSLFVLDSIITSDATILDSVTESGLGSHLGTISVAASTCADDILVLAHSECELQSIMVVLPPAYHRLLLFLISVFHQY
jgi:hypothetical protein